MVLRKMSRIEKVWRIGTMLFLVCIGKVEKGLCDLGFYWSPGIFPVTLLLQMPMEVAQVSSSSLLALYHSLVF